MKKILVILLVTGYMFWMPACNSSKVRIPSDIIPEKKMQQVMIDVLTAESYANMRPQPIDTTRKVSSKLYNQIYKKYNISKDEYFRSYNFYARHPALFEKNMQPVIDSLNAMDARTPGSNVLEPVGGATQPNPTNPTIIHNMPRTILNGRK